MWKRSKVSPLGEIVEIRSKWNVPVTRTDSPHPGTLNANGRSVWFVTTANRGCDAELISGGPVTERSHAARATIKAPARTRWDIETMRDTGASKFLGS
jgi:hypothetical protein